MPAPVPQLFGNERHQRMQQQQRLLMNLVRKTPIRIGLLEFQIPIAKLVPKESPNRVGGFMIAMRLKRIVRNFDRRVQTRADPSIRQRSPRRRSAFFREQQPRSVPDLISEVAPAR